MARFCTLDSSFWSSPAMAEWSADERYIYLYCMTNPHINLCGCFEVSIRVAARETGIDSATVLGLIQRLQTRRAIIYDPGTKEILIPAWFRYSWTASPKWQKKMTADIAGIKSARLRQLTLGLLAVTERERARTTYRGPFHP